MSTRLRYLLQCNRTQKPKHDSPLLVSVEVMLLMQPSTLPKICMEHESCIFWPVALGNEPIDKSQKNWVNAKAFGLKTTEQCAKLETYNEEFSILGPPQWWINMVPGRSREWQIMLMCQNSWVLYSPNRIYNRTCLHFLAYCITQEISIGRQSSPKTFNHHHTALCYPIQHKIVFQRNSARVIFIISLDLIESYVEITWHHTTIKKT